MAEELPSREILEQIVERLDHLESLLQSNTARLHAIERRMAIEPLLPVRQRRPPHEPRAGESREGKGRDLESLIGGVWFAWAGIIFVVLTVAFTLKLAIDNDWIGPGARVLTGGVGGVALLYVAERLRGRGLRQYAFILSG